MPKPLTSAEAERFLRSRRVAVLTTINADGTPLPTPIWYLYSDGLIYMRTGEDSAKARNIRRDPRVSLCVQDERAPYRGVTVKGTATIEPTRAGLDEQMARHYLGAIAGFFYLRLGTREEIEESADAVLVIKPMRSYGWDYTPQTPLVGRLWLAAKRILPPWL